MTAVTVLTSEVINATMEYGRQGPHNILRDVSSAILPSHYMPTVALV